MKTEDIYNLIDSYFDKQSEMIDKYFEGQGGDDLKNFGLGVA